MASGTIDELQVGHVLQYVYLFLSEAEKGRDEGVKERPVVVIDIDYAAKRVAILAVTTKGEGRRNAVPIPADVAAAAGLDHGSFVVTDEYNTFRWLGYDIRPVGDGWIRGRLTPGFTRSIRAMAHGATGISRD